MLKSRYWLKVPAGASLLTFEINLELKKKKRKNFRKNSKRVRSSKIARKKIQEKW